MMDIDAAVNFYEREMIQSLKRVVAIESVESDSLEGMPFGRGPADALCETLNIAKDLGFDNVVNLDNYAGYVQIGSGDELIGILGHVDIVPLGEGWTHDPLGCEISDGKIYGRGVSDDKAPVIIALYAMKILSDAGVDLKRRIRLVIGANEETGFGCMKHYREVEEPFTFGFTPDAEFPLIFGEKGTYHGYFSGSISTCGEVKIKSIKGGEAFNVVAQKCYAEITSANVAAIKEKFDKFISEHAQGGDFTVNGNDIKIMIEGIPAHASTPQLGLNAISLMMKFLGEITEGAKFVEGYNKTIGMHYDGTGCDVKYNDEYGELTFNVGIISTNEDTASATIDIRYPLTTRDFKPYADKISSSLSNAGLTLDGYQTVKPLFVDPESDFIKALYTSYSEVTGDNINKPFTIGGGTYAKAFKNVVAFGCEFPNSGPYNIHAADENMSIDEMKLSLKIFVDALMKLNEL